MKKIIIVCTLVLTIFSLQSCSLLSAAGLSSQGQPTKEVSDNLNNANEESSVAIDHSDWDRMLKTYVNAEGMVNYKKWSNNRAALTKYLNYLSAQKPLDSWSVQELLAYYINLYNAYTVNLILDNYPLQSIKDINGAWTKAIVPIDDRTLSLGGIENGVLRKMNEPRIHFAINCASISCPKLLREAFTAAKINEQLDRATSEFINSDKNLLDPAAPQLSSLFDWYKKDYLVNGNESVVDFINQYANTKINQNASISYKDYNWNLNDQE